MRRRCTGEKRALPPPNISLWDGLPRGAKFQRELATQQSFTPAPYFLHDEKLEVVTVEETRSIITPLLKQSLGEMLNAEALLYDVFRDMLKEEIKKYVMKRLDEDPKLKEEIKQAISMYFEAKLREMYAGILLAKSSAKLGFELVPENLKKEMWTEIESEMAKVIESTFK